MSNHTSIYYEIKLESHRNATPNKSDKVIELSLFLWLNGRNLFE